jgi:hypothetical protein
VLSVFLSIYFDEAFAITSMWFSPLFVIGCLFVYHHNRRTYHQKEDKWPAKM